MQKIILNKYFKSFGFLATLTVVIIITALLAVPYIYSKNELQNYIESNVVIPGGKKVKINSGLDFGVFPKISLDIADLDIIDKFGSKQKVKNFQASMGFFDAFTGYMRVKYSGVYGANPFKGKLSISDYYAMQKRKPSEFKLRLDIPFVIELTGTFQLKENEIALHDYNLYHKTTRVSGDIILTRLNDVEFSLINHISLVTENLDDIHKLLNQIYFDKNTYENFQTFEGSGRMNFTFSAKGDSIFALKRNLSGQGSIRLKDVKINGYSLDEIAKDPVNVKFLPDESRVIAIDNVSGVFTVLNGIFSTNDFQMKGKKLNFSSSGGYDIADEKIDLAINLNADLSTAKITLPLIIRGDLSSPRIIGNYAKASGNNGEEPTPEEQAQLRANLDNLANFVNEKIIQNSPSANLEGATPETAASGAGILDEILPWQTNKTPAQARDITPQEEDSLIGNWNSAPPASMPQYQQQLQQAMPQPNPVSYEQQQIQKAREAEMLRQQKLQPVDQQFDGQPDQYPNQQPPSAQQPVYANPVPANTIQPTTIITTPVDNGTSNNPDSSYIQDPDAIPENGIDPPTAADTEEDGTKFPEVQ
jgi:hypothetical protein